MTKRNADLVGIADQGERYSEFSRVLEQELESDIELRREYEAELVTLRAAAALNAMRLEKGWSQSHLAALSGTTQPMLSRLFSGDDDRSPTLETLSKIALAFGRRLRIEFVDLRQSEQASGWSVQRPTIAWAAPAAGTTLVGLDAVARETWIPGPFASAANIEAGILN